MVQPQWIQQVLAAQLEDGSWSGFNSLLKATDDTHIGFKVKMIGLGRPEGSLHATPKAYY